MKLPACEIELTDGTRATLREATPDDAERMLRFLQEEVATSPYVLTVPEETGFTVEEEAALVEERRADPRSLWILALVGDEIAGSSTLFAGARAKSRHCVELGTTVASAYRNRGLGRAMLRTLVGWARAHPEILRITLDVMAVNAHARRIYREAGFREIGVERRAYRQPDGSLLDGVPMELWVGHDPPAE